MNDGTRNLLRIGYDATNRPNSIQNADDLDPGHASGGYLTNHALAITYTSPGAGQVATISDAVRNRDYSPSTLTRTWGFTYYPGTCPGATLHSPVAAHGFAQPSLAGCTTIASPSQYGQPSPQVARVFYDNLAHPLEIDSPLQTSSSNQNFQLYAYDKLDLLNWTEDGAGNPSDYTYDTFTHALLTVTGPDPDGTGPLARPVTTYRYDETNVGTATAPGTPLQGLQARYYPVSDLSGYPAAVQTDANIDSSNWGGTAPPALGGQTTNFSIRWSGAISVSAGSYVFATVADGGTRVFVDGAEVVNDWTGQTTSAPYCAAPINLTGGRHQIVVDYHETTGTASVKLESGSTCTALSIVGSSALLPEWLNQTSIVTPPDSNGGAANVAFAHYAVPGAREPDYELATSGGSSMVTSFEYDSYGRVVKKTMPKGNVGRLQSNGTLAGSADSTYSTFYAYYTAGQTAAPPAACGGTAVNQLGLLQSEVPHGLTGSTFVYDAAGRALGVTKAVGTTCNTYDGEGNLTSTKAPGEASATTYAYDPTGQVLSATNAAGTLTYTYNEGGQLIDRVDSFGAEQENVYDADGNVTMRRIATSPLATAPSVYNSTYAYDAADELASLTDPAGHSWSFFYDADGRLKATTYPNTTFSWNDYLANGWLQDTLNRHGSFSTPPSSAPTDANALSDYSYTYEPDGQRASETRSGGSLATGTTSYTYDGVGRLDSVTFGDGSARRYCYDLDSDRANTYYAASGGAPACGGSSPESTYAYTPGTTPGVDELTSRTLNGQSESFTYDGDGNMTVHGPDTLTWDGRGRNSGGVVRGTQIAYTYDAAGDLVQRVGTVRYSGQILQVAPAVYWRLDDAAGTTAYDSSDNTLPGTYAGGVTLGQPGAVTTEPDTAASFNGSTGTVTRPVVSAATAGMAIETWFYWGGGTSAQQIVAYNGTPGTNGYGIAVGNGSCGGGSTIELLLGGVSCGAVSGGTATANSWYHVVASRSTAGTWTLYVNAVSKGTSTLAPLAPTGSTSVSPASFPFGGRIDEFALYGTGLAASIVTAHYQRASATTAATTRFLLGDALETDGSGTVTAALTVGPAGILARYAGAPAAATSVNYL
ncbi:MAG TPA: PA14 domain-containing protein, partial [Gaiellaceae bacterium]|nr:PA14 domain-containing protein [Gaiellaceae bacterium]